MCGCEGDDECDDVCVVIVLSVLLLYGMKDKCKIIVCMVMW